MNKRQIIIDELQEWLPDGENINPIQLETFADTLLSKLEGKVIESFDGYMKLSKEEKYKIFLNQIDK